MQSKRPFIVVDTKRDTQKQLEFMYARRYALDTVIENLEAYNRYRARRPELSNLKTA
jgi:hypothetical protein